MSDERQSASEEIIGPCPAKKPIFKGADSRIKSTAAPDGPANNMLRDKKRLDAETSDVVRNCELVAGAVQHNVQAAVGERLRLKPMPCRDLLGLNPREYFGLVQNIKKRFRYHTESKNNWVDITGHNNLTELAYQHTYTQLVKGESLAAFYWRNDNTRAPFRSAVGMIDTGRLRTPDDKKADTDNNIIQGIDFTQGGYPRGYYIHDYHCNDVNRYKTGGDPYTYVRARNELGREQILHSFHQTSPGLSRGISAVSCALRTIKKMEQYTDAQIESAIIQTMIAATIESDMPDTGDILGVGEDSEPMTGSYGFMCDSIGYHEKNDFTFNGSIVPKLYNHESLNIQTPGRFAQDFEAFSKSMWTGVARCFGLSLETFTQDWGDTSYSGARAGFLSMWRHVEWLRATIAADFAQRFYCVWLEEQIITGGIEIPGMRPIDAWLLFQDNRDEFAYSKFYGAARDEIDRERTAKAYIAEKELGVFTRERYCNEVLGEDWCDVKEQQIIEELYCSDLREEYGLPEETEAQNNVDSGLLVNN